MTERLIRGGRKKELCGQRIRNECSIFSLLATFLSLLRAVILVWRRGNIWGVLEKYTLSTEDTVTPWFYDWSNGREGNGDEGEWRKGERGEERVTDRVRQTGTKRDKKADRDRGGQRGDRGRTTKRGKKEGMRRSWQMCSPLKFTPWCPHQVTPYVPTWTMRLKRENSSKMCSWSWSLIQPD